MSTKKNSWIVLLHQLPRGTPRKEASRLYREYQLAKHGRHRRRRIWKNEDDGKNVVVPKSAFHKVSSSGYSKIAPTVPSFRSPSPELPPSRSIILKPSITASDRPQSPELFAPQSFIVVKQAPLPTTTTTQKKKTPQEIEYDNMARQALGSMKIKRQAAIQQRKREESGQMTGVSADMQQLFRSSRQPTAASVVTTKKNPFTMATKIKMGKDNYGEYEEVDLTSPNVRLNGNDHRRRYSDYYYY